jgi:hypothetical protein
MFGIEAKKILIVVITVLAVLGWRDWSMRAIEHAPGVLVPEQPVQHNLDGDTVIGMDEFLLKARARFQIRARVLSRENYGWGTEAQLSPVDLALGWGVMSDQAVLDQIDIEQRSRWYFTRYELPAPISDQAIIVNSSNMHMIPADKNIGKGLKKVRKGDIVQLKGYLVDVDSDSGWHWSTSLSREDTGKGACEIVYLEYLFIESRG